MSNLETKTIYSISIIIPNYNYERYVAEAIHSALGLRGVRPEVIVVDDGSTDNSRAVIETFGQSVVKIYQENQSTSGACSAEFAVSTGDIVIFLDSDDVLDPSVGDELQNIWNERVSKVQFQMQRIDEGGLPRGSTFPAYRPLPTPAKIRHWLTTTTDYPTPPGSGNAYARRFLEQIFPLDPNIDRASDSFCLPAAPLFGDIVTINKPLVSYRRHDHNASKTVSFPFHIKRAMSRVNYMRQLAQGIGIELSDKLIFKSFETLQFRAASLRLNPDEHPIPGDSRARAMWNGFCCLLFHPQVDLRRRVALVMWVFAVLLLPLPIARRAIDRRYRR